MKTNPIDETMSTQLPSLEERIKAWYKDLPEITLPNIDSEDGTFMELNMVDLTSFVAHEIAKARIDEVKRLQAPELLIEKEGWFISLDTILSRIKELEKGNV